MTDKRLKPTLEYIIAARRQYAKDLAKETNPQLVECRVKAQAEAGTLQAVLDALRGDPVQLRIMAEH